MRPLLVDEKIRKEIDRMIERAKANPISLEFLEAHTTKKSECRDPNVLSLEDRKPGFERPPSEHIEIPHGYRAAYSVENQPAGACAHLSISVDTPGKLPHPMAVRAIAMHFHIDSPIRMWLEEFDPGYHAVNLLQLMP